MRGGSLTTDVLIAGAGPAGLAAAIAARQRGFRVTLAEAARPPVDKVCGEGVMPGGVRALKRLGVSLSPRDCFPIRGIRFLGRGESASADFPEGMGLGVRRTTLYQALMERAVDAGTSTLWGARVQSDRGEPVAVNGAPARYTWLVGADGMNSQVRRWGGLDAARRRSPRFGFRRHFCLEPWTDYVEVHWGQESQIFITPVSPKEVCVAVLSRHPQPRLAGEIASFAEVARRLQGALPMSPERGAVTANVRLRAVARHHVALVGDASGSVHAITGEGLSLAFQQALALAEALEKDDLGCYRTAHRRIMRVPFLMARFLLRMERHDWLRRRALRGLAAEPAMFSRLVAVHSGALPPAAIRVGMALALCWRVLTA